MASCPKCGKRKIRKNLDGNRECRHCGVLRGIKNLSRSGNAQKEQVK